MKTKSPMRPDYEIISEWIKPGSRVLDLGCGDGTLLNYLAREKQVSGYGVELDDHYISRCIRSGVNIIQSDLNQGLSEFDEDSFNYVVLSLTLQAMRRPDLLLQEMMRVGTEGIVTFPNFGHWRSRFYLGVLGRMPISRTLPNKWYDTPNIHLCTIRDFEDLCGDLGFHILERCAVNHVHKTRLGPKMFPNLLGQIALYRFRRK